MAVNGGYHCCLQSLGHNTSSSLLLRNGFNRLVVHYIRLERLARDKHSSLLVPFISYEENKVL
jgi:hypothetical protein